MSSFREKAIKIIKVTVGSTALGVLIIGSGYTIMRTTTPSSEEMHRRIGHINPDILREDQKRNAVIMKTIIENSKLDNPAWDIDWPEDIQKSMASKGR
ncbi:hypothetical protein BDV3_002906 [Batrachochytrium dendrobatidis]|nr:hypothetical protein QVD99_001172 [Batrachochytrium dendrobatidis]